MKIKCFFIFVIAPLPRYVRVNTLKNTVNEVVDSFVREGWTFIENQVRILQNILLSLNLIYISTMMFLEVISMN